MINFIIWAILQTAMLLALPLGLVVLLDHEKN